MTTGIDKYRSWLRGLVDLGVEPSLSYDILFQVAFEMDYRYFVPNDSNRAADGLAVREKFESENSYRLPDLGECRILEFLVGVAIRVADVMYINAEAIELPDYFWHLIENLDLDTNDDGFLSDQENETDIATAFDIMCDRKYGRDGSGGGLFPLANAHEDQTKVEVWYQMQAYLGEKEYF